MKTIIAVAATLLLSACGADMDAASRQLGQKDNGTSALSSEPASPEQQVDREVNPGVFKLYKEPGTKPDSQCDVFTRLTLSNGIEAPEATLQNAVQGLCAVSVDGRQQTFLLHEEAIGCGSRHFLSDKLTSSARLASKPVAIEVIDHRARICKDIVPAKIIVNETFADGHMTTLYSSDVPSAAQNAADESFTGKLVRVAGIGGESTGYGLQLANGQIVELDLSAHNFGADFQANRMAAVEGTWQEVHGIEIPSRQVLVVTSFTLQ